MPNTLDHFDVAISGAGPVGLALAALLVQQGIAPQRLLLLDAKPTERINSPQPDPRSIALSYGSAQILQKIGAWPIGAWPLAASTIEEIHVSRRGHFGRTLMRCQDVGLPALGYVMRYGTLVETLANLCTGHGIRMIRPVNLAALTENDQEIQLLLAAESSISAKLMVQAEGGQFAEQPSKTRTRDYQQVALVAQVAVSAPVMHRAFERFTDEGPLALLPQRDTPGRAGKFAAHDAATPPTTHYALVWCMRAPSAHRLILLPEAAFLAALQQAFGTRLGRFLHATSRTVYPLGLNAGAADTARSVAIGNAAQTLHPVAGQGLNLGMRDAAVLARLLAQDTTPAALASFLAQRRRDRNTTIQLTDVMARIFVDGLGKTKTARSAFSDSFTNTSIESFTASPVNSITHTSTHTSTHMITHTISQSLLGLSLGIIDGVAPAKRLLARQMMFGSR